jgi:hypothetical protein
MKSRKSRLLLSLTGLSTLVVLNLAGQSSRPAPPTMLRIQSSPSPSLPDQPGLSAVTPPKLLPVIPDSAAPELVMPGAAQPGPFIPAAPPGKLATNRPPMFTNHPPAFATRSPVFTNHPVKIFPLIFEQPKSTNETHRL